MQNGNQPILDNQFEDNKGLTKREYFAGLAMQSLIVSNPKWHTDAVARFAIKIADDLLKELDKPKNE